jgi:hypothetical protein
MSESPISRLLLLTVAVVAAFVIPASIAQADQMTVFTCHDPAGHAVGHDGWTIARTGDQHMTAADTCGASGQGTLSLDLGENPSGYQNGARIEWVFQAPSWATIANYAIQVPDSYAYPYAGAGQGQVAMWASDESDPVYDYRNYGGGSWGAGVVQRTPPAPVSAININASCDGATGACPTNVHISHVDVSAATLVLSDATTPSVTNLGGSLASPSTLTGAVEVSFDAADSGPGVYSAWLVVDGNPQPAVILNSNSGWCQNLGQTTDGTRSFAHPTPCAQSTTGSLTLDTTRLADGRHAVKLVVDDAAGNATSAFNAQVTTDNAPTDSSPPTVLAPSQVFVGAVLSTQPGAWSAPSGAGSIAYGYQWEDCDAQGNSCQAIAGAQNASYTPAPSDVGHTLRVLVNASDSDGLASAASAATSAVLSSQGSLGALPGPGTAGTSGVLGSGSAVGQGAPNGMVASEGAVLHLGVRRTISRSFARRSLKIPGRLLDSHGHPIGGATLDVLQQIAGSGALQVIRHANTRANGSFVAQVPGGPSRIIEVAYRAFSGDANYAAQAKIKESVGAGVQLNISPRGTSSTGTITLRGRVVGPVPSQGVVVELLVHYRGRWEPFRDPRTDSRGRFEVAYQFEGGVGRFPFRAEVFGGQSGFPFTHGDSRPVNVTTN